MRRGAQAEHFSREGFLLLKGVLPPALVERCLGAVDQMVEEYEAAKPDKHGQAYTIIQTLLKSGAGTDPSLVLPPPRASSPRPRTDLRMAQFYVTR